MRRNKLRVKENEATGSAVRLLSFAEAGDSLAHLNDALDDPVERSSIQQFGLPLRHHARAVKEARLLPRSLLRREPPLLPLGQLLDAVDTDAQLDDVHGHWAAPLFLNQRRKP